MAELAIRKLVMILIITLVVFIVLLSFVPMFREKVFGWIKGLPEYKYEHDEEIDITGKEKETESLCPVDMRVGKIGTLEGKTGFRKQYIYFLESRKLRKSNLYWDGREKEAEIYLDVSGKPFVAEVKKGKISVNQNYFNLDSAKMQKIRFENNFEINLIELANQLAKLNNAEYSPNNWLCKKEEKEIEIKPAWSDKGAIILKWEDYKPQIVRLSHTFWFSKDVVKINFPMQYFEFGDYVEFLYVIPHKNYLELKGRSSSSRDLADIGRIYPDGSIWFHMYKLKQAGIKLSGEGFWSRYNEVRCPRYKDISYEEMDKQYKNLPCYEINIRILRENYHILKANAEK
jgi:hypothetical protein